MLRKSLWLGLATVLAVTLSSCTELDVVSVTNPVEQPSSQSSASQSPSGSTSEAATSAILSLLDSLAVKGRAPKTGYSRAQFSSGWDALEGCDTRNRILKRDLTDLVVATDSCKVLSGKLVDPYTAEVIEFTRGVATSAEVQIDHVVALSDAWQKGAQALSADKREAFYHDPINLLAVSGAANQQKKDSDAASWLPSNKAFRCQYVSMQIAVKAKYSLWVTAAEKEAMKTWLATCP